MFIAKAALLGFWTLWFGVTLATNVGSALKALKVLPRSWKFASDNFRAVADAVAAYRVTQPLATALFLAVIVWQLAACFLFARAIAVSWSGGTIAYPESRDAFVAGGALWAAFMLADEIFLQYERQASHATLFIAQLASLIALYMLPD
ncbi:MAG TPA: hypothetical protein VHL99_05165 [Candidatus Binatia bacterium]|jgi:hypothetical protein|nr:hypothetical protein [Candidatus Binatia bacterium]